MPLINWKTELKLKWRKYLTFYAVGADNVNNKDDNIIFIIKDTKLNVPVVNLSAKDNQKRSKLLSKRFERSIYWNEYKLKSENKNATSEYRKWIYFLESNFVGVNRLFVLVYLNRDNNVKYFNARKYDLPTEIIAIYNVIINGKDFYDQAIDSDITRYEEI